MAAKIDETADFLCAQQWGQIDYPAPFGRSAYPEEAFIREMDGKTGASLKLTILNPKARCFLGQAQPKFDRKFGGSKNESMISPTKVLNPKARCFLE